ncbi:MAG: hypothetical protein LBK56_09560 [Gracilibacteraceae bacterium]|jgi:hypothetical protein|nr:hypothetical protein [Gracilibacteraceae bacterium]
MLNKLISKIIMIFVTVIAIVYLVDILSYKLAVWLSGLDWGRIGLAFLVLLAIAGGIVLWRRGGMRLPQASPRPRQNGGTPPDSRKQSDDWDDW